METNLSRADFRVLAICFTILVFGNWYTVLGSVRCEREQSSLINQTKVVECTITGSYYGVYWYIGESKDSIIRRINGHKAGSEYQSGKLDIATNGSMIIKSASVDDEKTYRVMVVWNEGGDDHAYVHLTVIVPSSRDIPTINRCNNSGSCRLCLYRPINLKCTMDGRPPVDLNWYDTSAEILPESKNFTESLSSQTFISSSVTNVHLDSPEIQEIVCEPSGPAVTLHEGVKNASVLIITPSNPYISSKETFYLSASNGSAVIGQNTPNTVAWIKQTANIHFSLKALSCNALDWSENGTLTLQLNSDFEGIYTQVVKKDGNTFERNIYEVRRAKGPKQYNFIEECLSQEPQNSFIYVDGSGVLTCSVYESKPAGSIMWNVTQSGLLVNFVSAYTACEDGLCNTSATVTFQFANSQTEVGELECIVNGPWDGFPLSSIVQVFNTRYFTTTISSKSTSIESKSPNTQSAVRRARNTTPNTQISTAKSSSTDESRKDRTSWAVPFLLVVIIFLVVVIGIILYKDRAWLCEVLHKQRKKSFENENNVNEQKNARQTCLPPSSLCLDSHRDLPDSQELPTQPAKINLSDCSNM